jgi:hypothetical protein
MKVMTKLLALLLFLTAPVFADQIITDFKFDGGRGNIGKVDVFALEGPFFIVLAGYDGPFALSDMFEKDGGPGDTGIGLAANVHHEISSSEFVQVNLAQIFALHPKSVELVVGSIVTEEGESYDVWGSTTPGLLGKLLGSDLTAPDFILPQNFNFVSLSGHGDSNVLLEDVTADFRSGPVPTPESSTLVLMLIGLVVLTIAARKHVSRSSVFLGTQREHSRN